jgi:hypothetical protein
LVNDELGSQYCYGPKKPDGTRAKFLKLPGAAEMAGWPTPNTPSGGRSMDPEKMSSTGVTLDGRKHTVSLEHVVRFAGWPTPTTRDHKDGDEQSCANVPVNALLGRTATLAEWNTPMVSDAENSCLTDKRLTRPKGTQLREQVHGTLAGWATPRVSDIAAGRTLNDKGERISKTSTEVFRPNLADQVTQATLGATSPSSHAGTEKRGALNPRFSLWLMGYPEEWASCGERAMQSCRSSPRSSSKPSRRREQ